MSIPKFAAPLQWNSTRTYTKGEVVYTGWNAYTALQNVPANTPITNSSYWVLTGNLRERVYSGSGGSGGMFIIIGVIGGTEQQPTITVDRTYAEINAAFENGEIPILGIFKDETLDWYSWLHLVFSDVSNFIFSDCEMNTVSQPESITQTSVFIADDDTTGIDIQRFEQQSASSTTLEMSVGLDRSDLNNPPKVVIENGKALKDALDAFISSDNITYERCYISFDNAYGNASRIYDTLNYCYGQSGENVFNCFIQANFIDSSEVMKINFDSSLQSNPYSIHILGFNVSFDSSNIVGNNIIAEISMT